MQVTSFVTITSFWLVIYFTHVKISSQNTYEKMLLAWAYDYCPYLTALNK